MSTCRFPAIVGAGEDTTMQPDLVGYGGQGQGLAIDSQYMYWIQQGAIGRSALDGSSADHSWMPGITDTASSLTIGP